DIVNLSPVPPLLFLTGDLVLNEATDEGQTLAGQLEAWASLYETHPSGIASRLTPVVLTGNHEALQSPEVTTAAGSFFPEFPNRFFDPVWVNWLSTHGFDAMAGNGPGAGSPASDLLADDQSRLSFSFNRGDVHFVVLNTDSLMVNDN